MSNTQGQVPITIAADTLTHAGAGTAQRSLAVQAGCILLRHDPARFWRLTVTVARTDEDFGRELALVCSSRHIREVILGRLPACQGELSPVVHSNPA
ncbi:hypothetical protein LZG04_12030 [Saccharothrix sp. S26]|uniref:hypothetical protein n=1 Tax=Saccharothrix sp. S26 TaxID=2907215 RepID=UPI001F3F7A22|nr:hypothetical protein [Saccharothrix sp. S26]MCE6995524.1 hypothetical protein [Saccharothrix sp. S26]